MNIVSFTFPVVMPKKISIIFLIECGPSRMFEDIPDDHEWRNLGVGSTVEIYHSKEKWEGIYTVTKVGDDSEQRISYSLRLRSVHLHCTTAGHNKEWFAKVIEGKQGTNAVVQCSWGKIGGSKQQKDFSFNSTSQALQYVHEKIEEKLKKGYTT